MVTLGEPGGASNVLNVDARKIAGVIGFGLSLATVQMEDGNEKIRPERDTEGSRLLNFIILIKKAIAIGNANAIVGIWQSSGVITWGVLINQICFGIGRRHE